MWMSIRYCSLLSSLWHTVYFTEFGAVLLTVRRYSELPNQKNLRGQRRHVVFVESSKGVYVMLTHFWTPRVSSETGFSGLIQWRRWVAFPSKKSLATPQPSRATGRVSWAAAGAEGWATGSVCAAAAWVTGSCPGRAPGGSVCSSCPHLFLSVGFGRLNLDASKWKM